MLPAFADTKIQFSLDWKFEGPATGFFAGIDNGHFETAGLDVEISPGQDSPAAIPKVATGAFQISTILMADHGLELYGNAIIVNTNFAAENPELVKGFLEGIYLAALKSIRTTRSCLQY